MMLPEKKQVLVVDDEANLRRVLSALLTRDGCDVHTAENGEAALAILREHHVDLVITDLKMPKMDGVELLREIQRTDPDLPVVMLTAHGTVDNAVEALKLGALDYLTKPFDNDEIRTVVNKALRTRDLSAADARYEGPTIAKAGAGARYGIIGESNRILEIYAVLERVADTPTTVLITGESGTGKELVARALHENSSRKDKPFIKVNCAAIPKDLMESELFGYERGAFTGAVGSKPGRFELASAGTLFLDEIAEIPVEMQVKLLRVLQESEFERVGGVKTIRVDVRLVAATNRDLKKEIAAGTFREDLYYRLNVVPIVLPALRDRVSDIPLLVDFFLAKFNTRLKKQVTGVDADAMTKLEAYAWHGNIRELENVMERAILFADGPRVREQDLSPEVRGGSELSQRPSMPPQVGDDASLDGLKEKVKAATSRIERELIQRALDQTGGNVTHGARLLKISRKGLQLKMKELGLRERDERGDLVRKRWCFALSLAFVGCRHGSQTTVAEDGGTLDLPAQSVPLAIPKGMVFVPPGVLLAGTPEGRLPRIADAEMPGSQVVMHGFFIDEYPFPNEAGSIPRTGVSEREAEQLCGAQQKRLCSELEWERACKGPENTTYPYGTSYQSAACGTGLLSVGTPPTGVLATCKSAFGMHDTHGTVWQWTSSPWGRGSPDTLYTLRGGNAEAGEVVGRCANGIGRRPTEGARNYGFRCCSGDRNVAEVTLDIVRGEALRNVSNDKAWLAELTANPPAELTKRLAGKGTFQVLTTWRWRPIGNEELVLQSGCAQIPPHALCGIAIARLKGKSLEMLAFASTDWWVPTLKDDIDPRDLWVFGGDELGAFRRKLQYAWGQIIVGDPEFKVKPGSPKEPR